MKKTIRLTESDINRLVQKVINEDFRNRVEKTPEEIIANKEVLSGTWSIESGHLRLKSDVLEKQKTVWDVICK